MQENILPDASAEIASLVDKARNGDGEAFGRLYDMHIDRVYRHIYYRVNNTADAEDLTQRVFTKAWEAIGRYRNTGSPFIAWLIRISHNLVIDFYRSKKPEPYIDFDIVDDDPETNPAEAVETRFSQYRVRQAIRQLNSEQQQVILMRFIEDFSHAEIAAAMGKSEGAVRVIQHRGLVKLRKILEDGR